MHIVIEETFCIHPQKAKKTLILLGLGFLRIDFIFYKFSFSKTNYILQLHNFKTNYVLQLDNLIPAN